MVVVVIAFEVEEYKHLDHTSDASFVDVVVVVLVASWADAVETGYIDSDAAVVALEDGANQEKVWMIDEQLYRNLEWDVEARDAEEEVEIWMELRTG